MQRQSHQPKAQALDTRSTPSWRRRGLVIAGGVALLGLGLHLVSDKPAKRLDPVVVDDFDAAGGLDPSVARLVADGLQTATNNPDSADAHGTLAMIYESNGFWAEAARSYANAEQLDADEPRWSYRRAIMEWQIGDIDSALARFQRLAEAYPESAAIQHRHAEYLSQAGEERRAEAAFARLISLAPRAPQGYADIANLRIRRGEYGPATRLLERAVNIDPGYKPAHYLLGLCHRALGRIDAAQRELALGEGAQLAFLPDEDFIRLAGFSVNTADLLAKAQQIEAMGRPAEAAALLESARRERPQDFSLLNNLAAIYLDSGQPQKALGPLLDAKNANPAFPGTYINLATCCLRFEPPAAQDALVYSRQAADLAPQSSQAHLVHADALMHSGHYEQALTAACRAAEVDPANPAVHFKQAQLCQRLDLYEEAAAHYEEAVRRLPQSPRARAELAAVYIRLGRFEDARTEIAEAKKLNPNLPEVLALDRQLPNHSESE